ncbi:MAG: MFS transporter [Gammaproteobacteria bacterium]
MPSDADLDVVTQMPIARASKPLALVTLCLAVLIAQVDTSVVNLAVQPIGEDFKASVSALQWVVDSYNLFYAALLLTGGLLADLYGRRRVFMGGAAIFTLSSLVCALSPTIQILIGGRATAGLGAALLMPASLAIIRVVWPESNERNKVLGIWAATNGLALAIGPTLGGVLIGTFGWRSIFLLVVPIGFLAIGLAPRCIAESADPAGRHFDGGGQMFGAVALGSIAVAAIELHRNLPLAGFGIVGAVVALALFINVERTKGTAALVDLTMLDVRPLRGALAATAAMTFGMYGVLFLLPLMWQSEGLLGPVGAGLALIPMALVFVSVSPLSGALTVRFGARITTCGGVAVIGCGLMVLGLTADAASVAAAELGLSLTGLGMGLATGPLMGVAVSSVSARRSGSAAALINVARMIGATLGVAVLGTVFAWARGGPHGLFLAMISGGGVQISTAVFAWRTTRSVCTPR